MTGKQLLHIIRLSDMQIQLREGKHYADCLIPKNDSNWYKDVRLGFYDVVAAELIAEETCNYVSEYYKSLEKQEGDQEKIELMRKWKSSAIEMRLKEELLNEKNS